MINKYFNIDEIIIKTDTKGKKTGKNKKKNNTSEENYITGLPVPITESKLPKPITKDKTNEEIFIEGFIELYEREQKRIKKLILNRYETKLLANILKNYNGKSKEIKKMKSALQKIKNFVKIELNAKECVELYTYFRSL